MKTFKFRLYPNENQKILLDKHIGSSRFIYNFFLNYSKNCYENTKTSTSKFDWMKELTLLKKTEKYSWLNEINSQVLQDSLHNLGNSFQRFYKKLSGYPKFKKKNKVKWSFSVPQYIKLEYSTNNIKFGYLFIPKFKKDPIKVRIHRILPNEYKIKTATIVKTKSNKYYVSLVIEYQPQEKNISFVKVIPDGIGIDVGIKDTIVLSNGEKYNYPINSKKYDKKLKHLHKSLSRKYKSDQPRSKNFEKDRIKLAKTYEKINNIKENWIHQITKKLVAENQGSYFFLEDLNIRGMFKNHKLAKEIQFQSWYKFKEVLTYKSIWNGKQVISINRYEPSTKTCSKCGYINNNLTLDDRSWTCPNCNSYHDRDINAAINIKNFGINQLVAG
jgi:putative transposase